MKDTNAPARVSTSYQLFCDSKRKQVTRNNPDCSMTELSTIFGQLWSEASEKVKQPFITKAGKLKEVRDKKMEAYKQTPEYSEYLQRFRTDALIRKYASQLGINKKEFRMFPSDPNAPKRPLSSYMCFANDTRSNVVKKNPDSSLGEVGRIIGANWQKLSKTQKAKYEKMSETLKSKYEKAVVKYQKTNDYKEYMKIREEYQTEKKNSGKSTTKKIKKSTKNKNK